MEKGDLIGATIYATILTIGLLTWMIWVSIGVKETREAVGYTRRVYKSSSKVLLKQFNALVDGEKAERLEWYNDINW